MPSLERNRWQHRIQLPEVSGKGRAWPTDLTAFDREILPGLAGVPLAAITASTGLSVGYCRRVRTGLVRPHPMWWEALKALSDKRLVSGGA